MVAKQNTNFGKRQNLFKLVWMIFILNFLPIVTPSHATSPDDSNNWLEDIAVYREQMKSHHINPFHRTSETAFDTSLNDLIANLPNLTDWQVTVRLMEITRGIGDGHTSMPLWRQNIDRFPIEFDATEDGMIVSRALAEYKQLLGAKLISIDGTPVNKIYSELAKVVPFVENVYSEKVRVSSALSNAQLLSALELIVDTESAQFDFIAADSTKISMQLEPLSQQQRKTKIYNSLSVVRPEQHFQGLTEINSLEGIWAGYQNQSKTAYLAIESYPDMAAAMRIGEYLNLYLREHKAKHLIVDFRQSYGGDLYIGLLLASYFTALDSIDWQNGVYILISNTTFSAAMSNAMQYKRLMNATLVGQPTGAKPNGYQDMGQFVLPHSQLLVTYSKRVFRFADQEQVAVKPDKYYPVLASDLRKNHDAVLEGVLQQLALQ